MARDSASGRNGEQFMTTTGAERAETRRELEDSLGREVTEGEWEAFNQTALEGQHDHPVSDAHDDTAFDGITGHTTEPDTVEYSDTQVHTPDF
jgi:hypothetical protein